MSCLLRFLAVSLALLMLVSSAWAQTPPLREQLPSAELRDRWDRAGEMFDDDNYRGALIQYQSLYEATKNPRVLYNVGIAYKELRRYAKAIGAWQKQLTFRDELPASEVARAERAIELVRPFVSTLEVRANEPGATLLVNGDVIGRTPLVAPIPVSVGQIEVTLKKPGFVTVEKAVDVVKGEPASVEFVLVPADKTAMVSISTAGADDATIFIDGTEMGPAPFKGEVPVGRHTFEARAPGYVTARQTSEIAVGESVRITLSLVPARAEGKVKIVVENQPSATIVIDGEVVGQGAWEGVLPAGGHDLEVREEGMETYRSELALVADQERSVRIELQRDRTDAWIYWTVTGIAVVAGASVAGYFVLRPAESSEVTGTFDPGVVPTLFRF